MSASSYDGRRPEPPYNTDSDVVADLQEQLDAANADRANLREICTATLRALPVGSLPAHTVESIPERVQYYVQEFAKFADLAEAVQDSMGSVGGIPMTDRLADAFARCGMDVEREVESTCKEPLQVASPAPVVGGVPEIDAPAMQALANSMTDEEMSNDATAEAVWCAKINAWFRENSRLPALKPGEVENEAEWNAMHNCASLVGRIRWLIPSTETEAIADCHKAWKIWRDASRPALRAQATPTEKETDHG